MAVALCLYAKVIIKSGASSSVGFADTFPHLGKANSALCTLHLIRSALCTSSALHYDSVSHKSEPCDIGDGEGKCDGGKSLGGLIGGYRLHYGVSVLLFCDDKDYFLLV